VSDDDALNSRRGGMSLCPEPIGILADVEKRACPVGGHIDLTIGESEALHHIVPAERKGRGWRYRVPLRIPDQTR
jgi:hypothetical protein